MGEGKRGAYRALHTVLVDDPDFQDLSPNAKLIFYTGRLQLGPTGIGVLYESALADQTGIPSEGVRDGLMELVEGGWIEWQRNVIWFVNGLRFEPSISLGNDNHRTSVLNHLQGLPKMEIVNNFAAHYDLQEPFDGPSDRGWHIPTPSPADTPSDGMGDHGRTEERKTDERKVGSEGSLPSVENTSGPRPDVENSREAEDGESWNDRLAPLIRRHAYLEDGAPPGHSLPRCLDKARELMGKGYSVEDLEDAIRGLRGMAEQQHPAVRDWIEPEDRFTMLAFGRAEERGQKLIQRAASEHRKHAEVEVGSI